MRPQIYRYLFEHFSRFLDAVLPFEIVLSFQVTRLLKGSIGFNLSKLGILKIQMCTRCLRKAKLFRLKVEDKDNSYKLSIEIFLVLTIPRLRS